MRSCQNCAAPIPTAAKVCEKCGTDQSANVGLSSVSIPAVQNVAEENQKRDEEIGRFVLMALLVSSALIALITGISLSSLVVGAGAFFIALLVLFFTLQALGIDVGT